MVIDLDFWGVSRYSEISPPPLEIVEIFEKVEMLALKKNFRVIYIAVP